MIKSLKERLTKLRLKFMQRMRNARSAVAYRIREILRAKELPYILTILFALVGWTFSQISGILTKYSTIEYRFEDHKEHHYFSYRLTNLSRDKSFKDLNIHVELDTTDYDLCELDSGQILAISPAPRDGFRKNNDKVKNHINFTLKRMYPQTEYILVAYYTRHGNEKEVMPFFSYTNDDNETLILKKASVFTFLVKNELWVYTGLFIFLLILIFLYFLNVGPNHEIKTP